MSLDHEKKPFELEKDLETARRDLDSFFESAPIFLGIVEHSPDGIRYLRVNHEVANFFGKTAPEVTGKLVTELGMNAIILQEWIIRCRQAKISAKPVRWEFTSSRTETNRTFACHVNYIGSSESNDRYSFASMELTEKLTMQKKREEQAASLSHLSKMSTLGEMASGIAHEIYNPLSIIKGFADLIQKKALKGPVDPKELLQMASEVQSTAKRITEIIEGLRFFAREGTHDPMELTSVENLVTSTLKICSERFRKHNVKIDVKHNDKNLTVACREVQISQVLLNLLNNAFDSIKDRDEKNIWIETRHQNGMIIICVSDDGPGVPELIQEKIFEPFFTTKPIGLGTGMGLSICKRIMENHFGSIELIPSSQGARFQLSLPQGHVDAGISTVEN